MKGLNPIQYKSKVSASPPSPDLKVREAVDDRPVTSESLVREQRFIPVQYWPVVVRPGQRADVYKITGRQLVAEKDSFFYYYYSFNVLRKAGEATEKARGYLDRREDSLCTWKKGKAMQGKAEGRGHVDGAHRVVAATIRTVAEKQDSNIRIGSLTGQLQLRNVTAATVVMQSSQSRNARRMGQGERVTLASPSRSPRMKCSKRPRVCPGPDGECRKSGHTALLRQVEGKVRPTGHTTEHSLGSKP
ncbi:hypothetical protein RRG08_029754 [Elysia crispata]|uniref:Uncharacterized protein n=1 Tax=Elysia crispata TaxID=231223 RepID=A0AAE1B5P5_9GAST|nr:hypothetical protein RRG08_029754 [Elysia crispata]